VSEDNLELVYRVSDAFNRRDLDAFLSLADPDMEYHSRIAELEGGEPYQGHDGIRRWWNSLIAIAPDFNTEIEEARAIGDMTLCRVQQRGRVGEGAIPVEQKHWILAQWRSGRIVWASVFPSGDEALEAAELRR
jgi:ketosteroid isomerase-like protein